MRKTFILLVTLLSATSFSHGQAPEQWITVHDKDGVSLSYRYEKKGTHVDEDCNIEFDNYKISAKINNANSKAIDNRIGGSLDFFFSEYCTKGGILQNRVVSFTGLFTPHRAYHTKQGGVLSYLLDANDEYADANTISLRKGSPLPEPKWEFPEWHFINLPNKGNATPSKTTSTTNSYASLIIGKWKHTHSSTLRNEKEINFNNGNECPVIYESNKSLVFDIGGCLIGETKGKWSISSNILTQAVAKYKFKYKILELNDTTLKLKEVSDIMPADTYTVLTFTKQ